MIRAVAWADAVAVGRKTPEAGKGADWGIAAAANKRRGPTIARVVTRFAHHG
ncbi:MAG TPA: hypothetical protein VL336_00530 [Sphingomicrobium sp.]|nr:hypothetical protein [Sphingomicrobium sp.]